MKRTVYLAVLVVLVAVAAWSQSIKTDGVVEAQGFVGDGSQVTSVAADLLDSMDSAAFAQETDLQTLEALVAGDGKLPGERLSRLGRLSDARTGSARR
jgi:hypothetical protein